MPSKNLPPGVWECHGYHLAARAKCQKCGLTSVQKLSDVWIPRDSRDIGTETGEKTRVTPQSGGKGVLKRCSSQKLNKTEARFAEWVKTWPNPPVLVVPHPLPGIPLTDGDRYRPDFLLIFDGGTYQYAEVKGGYKGPGWEQGHERYKRARAEHPMIKFAMFEWTGKEWETK